MSLLKKKNSGYSLIFSKESHDSYHLFWYESSRKPEIIYIYFNLEVNEHDFGY